MIQYANIFLWGKRMGVVAQQQEGGVITFQYDDDFVRSGLNPSPLFVTPQIGRIYSFPELPFQTYKGLPAFIADSLPDKFGNTLINKWLIEQGREPGTYTTIERLLYQGSRSMGAMIFEPEERKDLNKNVRVSLDGLVEAAIQSLNQHRDLQTNLQKDSDALLTILRVGTSAGGARAKAVVAYNKETGDIVSGQLDAPKGYEHYLLKLDGVDLESTSNFGQTGHFGCIEYAYYQMARACGIDMMDSLLLSDGERHHFMTKRFDRIGEKDRLHMVSLCGMAQLDYNNPSAYAYEDLFYTMRSLRLPHTQMVEAFRRMVFNVVGCNQDDHTKNFSFLMQPDGAWSLSPAYDMSYAKGVGYTIVHQMSVNGKRNNITREDLLTVAKNAGITMNDANEIINQCVEVFSKFETFVDPSVPDMLINEIKSNLVLNL